MSDSRPIAQFRCNDIEKGKLHKEWEVWKKSLECYFEAEDITDQKKKRAKLLHLGGPHLQSLFHSLPNSEKFSYVTPEKQYYDVAILAFDQFFKPGRQDVLERHKLRHMIQNQDERFAEFVIRVRQQIKECGIDRYPAKCGKIISDIMLTDAIVEGCRSDELRKQILQKDRSVEEIEEIGKLLEGVEKQVKDFGVKEDDDKGRGNVYKIMGSRKPSFRPIKRDFPASSRGNRFNRSELRCFKCGLTGHISTETKCPARGKTCNNCQRMGHFESQCRLRKSKEQEFVGRSSAPKKIRVVEELADVSLIESKTESELVEGEIEKKTYYAFYAGNDSNVITCKVGGVELDLLVDSGAEANMISQAAWEDLKLKKVIVKHSEKGSSKILKGYASEKPLVILGTFRAEIEVGGKMEEALFFVVQGGQRCLLGDFTAKRLGVLRVGVNVDNVASKIEPLSKISGTQVHIHMDPEFKPVFQPMRRLPVALESAVFNKLEDLLARDVIEEKKGPATWVSPLVVVGKANGEPRICLDLRRVNEAVRRERHPMPLIDDFLAHVGKDMVRSKLDIKDSFLQLELDEDSRNVMVFITNRGLFRFKRMPFGLVTAPEIFQRTMDEILVGCEGAWWYIDDIYVEGKNKAEHDMRLAKVGQK